MEEQEREDEQFESLSEMRPTGALTRRVLDANYREPHLLLLDGFSISLDVCFSLFKFLDHCLAFLGS